MSGEPNWKYDIKDLTMEKHKNAEKMYMEAMKC